MQHLMEINAVMLHEVVETMPRRMHTVIKAKECNYFWTGNVKSIRPHNTYDKKDK